MVVNDGSKDDTAAICRRRGYNFIDLPVNLGLAGCFQTGMKYAWQKGYSYAVQFDGDGQHRPEYIKSMKEKVDYKRAEAAGECTACGDEVIDYSVVERYILNLEEN